ncbi:sensor histidine kinase [Reinekea thalattae]|uniref:Sensor histidine kinase n=1 Tax=Reinekea thalattae TaxID=2593301 RepID=A0A5C8ZBD2_9GAMM|nr:sensor histidine kinase [Reinekea thalattae]TXR54100.1 sensor histidine kinase [Reinekea thalattae]
MNEKKRLKQLVIAFFTVWILLLVTVVQLMFSQGIETASLMVALLAIVTGLFGVWMFNAGQHQVAEINKSHSITKRQVQELQLKIDRYEYDAARSVELRRLVANSTQEKDLAIQNMATALDNAMDEISEVIHQTDSSLVGKLESRVEAMKQYAADLQSLAQLELKTELPSSVEIDLVEDMERLVEKWGSLAKSRKVKIKLENPEDQILMISDVQWIENLLTRVVYALVRMNQNTTLHIDLINYTDAEVGDALRLVFRIDGRVLEPHQVSQMTNDYVSILEDGNEIGPGLTLVVAYRVVQILNGSLEISNTDKGIEALVVIPREPYAPDEEPIV